MNLFFDHSAPATMLAGVAFLILGLNSASDALQRIAANQIRDILNRISERGIVGVVVGVVLTLLMQSSGALTATLVNLGTAGVLMLPQVMGVLIGSAIGAALTVQLISLHVSTFGLPLFTIGFSISFLAKASRIKHAAEFLMALGMIFFGIEMIGHGVKAFVEVEAIGQGLRFLNENRWAALALSAVMASLFHSSTATIGIVIGFANTGVMTLEDAVIWVYGANIGTATTALVAAFRGNYVGKRIAWANMIYRVITVIVFLPFAPVSIAFLKSFLETPASQLALFYTLMNVFAASLFFPLRGFGVRIIEKIVQPTASEKEFGVKFLKRSTYDSFAIGLAHAKRETLEIGDIVYGMTELSLKALHQDDPDLFRKIKEMDDRVDLLHREIKMFLIRVSDQSAEGLNQQGMDLISFGSDLESAADVIDHTILALARKKHQLKLEFGAEAWKSLEELHSGTLRAINLALGTFQTEEDELGRQLTVLKHEIRDQERFAREAHLSRLGKTTMETFSISAIYLESLGAYLQVVEILSRHAYRTKKQARTKKIEA